MREINLGPLSSFADPGRRPGEVEDGVEVGVFRTGNDGNAWYNVCPHLGGPACQGRVIAKVDEDIAADGTSNGLIFSQTKLNVTCPWHGLEFDVRTGQHHGSRRHRLRRAAVRLTEAGEVILSIEEKAVPPVEPDRSARESRAG